MADRSADQLDALNCLHRLFEEASIEYWVFGGWAVDLHAGAVTRPHGDLDLAIWQADLARAGELLAADGGVHAPEPGEDGSTAFARGSVRLEVAFLARDEGGEIYTPLRDGRRAAWADGAFEHDVGEIAGVHARIISRRSLRAEKSEQRDDALASAKDRADVATLDQLGCWPRQRSTRYARREGPRTLRTCRDSTSGRNARPQSPTGGR